MSEINIKKTSDKPRRYTATSVLYPELEPQVGSSTRVATNRMQEAIDEHVVGLEDQSGETPAPSPPVSIPTPTVPKPTPKLKPKAVEVKVETKAEDSGGGTEERPTGDHMEMRAVADFVILTPFIGGVKCPVFVITQANCRMKRAGWRALMRQSFSRKSITKKYGAPFTPLCVGASDLVYDYYTKGHTLPIYFAIPTP